MAEKNHLDDVSRREYREPEDVIRCILQMELSGASLKYRDMLESNGQLYNAAILHFGCWGKALQAAGIDREAVSNRR